MTGSILRALAPTVALIGACASAAWAQQESSNRIAVETDWSVFVEEQPTKECWSVSRPTETVNTRDGSVVTVTRGAIRLFVSFRPESNVDGQVAFTGGYPFAPGSTVELTISDRTFELYTTAQQPEFAWPATDAQDAEIIAAMKRGANASLVARSSRGTRTSDTFSLFGFTAALDEARSRCS